jgi:hypothetical protein
MPLSSLFSCKTTTRVHITYLRLGAVRANLLGVFGGDRLVLGLLGRVRDGGGALGRGLQREGESGRQR